MSLGVFVTVKDYWLTTPEISQRMKRIRSSHTGLEGAMRKLLRQSAIPFRSQPRHFGRPDFWIKGTHILVFCDSSFWHGRTSQTALFSKNRDLWVAKIRRNIQRDKTVTQRLRREGWNVLRFWDTEILREPEKVLKKIRFTIRAKVAH
jgi:DNA mismatch endonuclease Vsr